VRYLFKHVLLRDAVYTMQLRTRLRELHQKAAETIETLHKEDLPSHYADLAYHSSQAEDAERALHYTRLAGERAIGASAFREAQTLLRQGLDFLEAHPLPDGPRHRALLLSLLGEACLGLSEYASAASFYEQSLAVAQQIEAGRQVAEALIGLGTSTLRQGDYAATRRHYEEAIGRSTGEPKVKAMALAGLGHVASKQGDYAAAWEYYWQSLLVRQASNDRQDIADSLGHLGNVAYVQGDSAMAEDYYRQGLAIWQALGHRLGIARCLNNLGAIAHGQGDYAQAVPLWSKAE